VLVVDSLQTNETELKQFFTVYGAVKDCKIIVDRGGISKRFESSIKRGVCFIIALLLYCFVVVADTVGYIRIFSTL